MMCSSLAIAPIAQKLVVVKKTFDRKLISLQEIDTKSYTCLYMINFYSNTISYIIFVQRPLNFHCSIFIKSISKTDFPRHLHFCTCLILEFWYNFKTKTLALCPGLWRPVLNLVVEQAGKCPSFYIADLYIAESCGFVFKFDKLNL